MKVNKSLQIDDLDVSLELDQAAMQTIVGGSARSFLLEPNTAGLIPGLHSGRGRLHLAQRPFARLIELD